MASERPGLCDLRLAGQMETDEFTYNRQDFWATSNRQLNIIAAGLPLDG